MPHTPSSHGEKRDFIRMRIDTEVSLLHEGQVIDHDPDLRTLHSRVYAVMGSVPVLLQNVTHTPAPDILVRRHRSGRAVRLA